MSLEFKRNSLLFIIILFVGTLHSQKLDHILGEVIVEVRNDREMKMLMGDLSLNTSYRSSMRARQLTKEPMNLWLVSVDPNSANEISFLKSITQNKYVLQAQKNHISELRLTPNDELFPNQWQFINEGQSGGTIGEDMDMDLAWDYTTGGVTTDGDTIVVCVVDDGINVDHPDLQGNLWINRQEIPGNNIDDDGNGYIDDVRGWNAYIDNDDITIDGSHGTSVAGIIGAKGNNEIGVAGVNWDVKLMIVRGGSPEATALASYAYPYTMRKLYNETNGEKGAFVVATNSSWGIDMGQPDDAPIWCDFYNKLGEVGILNFGATTNSNLNVDVVGDLPTACESEYLVSVTNMNHFNEKVFSAGFGTRSIDLGAMGEDVYTITYNSYGGNLGGTSYATPQVAGTAALLYAADCPSFTNLAKSDPAKAALVAKDCILHGVDPNTSIASTTTTGGTLNAHKSLLNLLATCDDCAEALGSEVEALTDVSGIVTWYDLGNIGIATIRYKLVGETEWMEINDVVSGFELTDLMACSSYEYQIKTSCPENPEPEYSYSRVFKTDGCCEAPDEIEISLDGEIATIQWNDVLATTNFVLEWRDVNEEEWNVVNLGKDMTFMLEGVLDCQFFEIRIKSECSATGEESMYSRIYEVNGECDGCTIEFCEFGEKTVEDEWIETVEIENVFSNTSGVNDAGYGNFLGQFDISLNVDEEYTLNLTPGYEDSMWDEWFSAYIDYNQNGEFEEEENIFRSEQSTQTTVTGNFIVPSDAIVGTSRMRVVMRFNALNGPCDQTGFDFGEVEDYCVNIMGDADCPTDFQVMVTDTSMNSLTFEIGQNNMIESYFLFIREKGLEDFIIISSPENIVQVDNLLDCTQYEFKSGFRCQGETFIDTSIFEVITKCDVSIVDLESLSLSLYPNPSQGNLHIDFQNPIRSEIRLELLTRDGRKVLARNIPRNGIRSMLIEAYDIPQGVYFLKVMSENTVLTKKWIKY